MTSEYPKPWKVYEGKLRPEFPTPIIEIHAADGSVPFTWGAFDNDGRSYAMRLRLAKRVVKAVNQSAGGKRPSVKEVAAASGFKPLTKQQEDDNFDRTTKF